MKIARADFFFHCLNLPLFCSRDNFIHSEAFKKNHCLIKAPFTQTFASVLAVCLNENGICCSQKWNQTKYKHSSTYWSVKIWKCSCLRLKIGNSAHVNFQNVACEKWGVLHGRVLVHHKISLPPTGLAYVPCFWCFLKSCFFQNVAVFTPNYLKMSTEKRTETLFWKYRWR